MVGSGLQILSDYPILRVRRMAFPAFACAGYDCLANKGALLVTVRLPGAAVAGRHRHHPSQQPAQLGRRRRALALRLSPPGRPAHRLHQPLARSRFPPDRGGRLQRRHAPAALARAAGAAFGLARRRSDPRRAPRGGARQQRALPRDVAAVMRHATDWEFFTSGTRRAPQRDRDPRAVRAGRGGQHAVRPYRLCVAFRLAGAAR